MWSVLRDPGGGPRLGDPQPEALQQGGSTPGRVWAGGLQETL